MKLNPRVKVVNRASGDIRRELEDYEAESWLGFLIAIAHVKNMILTEKEHGLPDADNTSLFTPDVQAINTVVRKAMQEHELTHYEVYQILTEYELSESKYLLRYERHGNFEKGAGEA